MGVVSVKFSKRRSVIYWFGSLKSFMGWGEGKKAPDSIDILLTVI